MCVYLCRPFFDRSFATRVIYTCGTLSLSLSLGGKLTMKSGARNTVASKGENLQRYASKPVIIHSLFVKGNRVWISV